MTLSTEAGEATARYTAGETSYRGPVKIEATIREEGAIIAGSAVLYFVDP